MRRAALLLVLTATASAHYVPGDRVVVVQAEKTGAAILVTYKPVDRVRDVVVGAAMAAPAGERRERLKALLAARALATLAIALDGRPLAAETIEVKLTEDSSRLTAAVLVSIAVPAGAHRLEVAVGESEEPVVSQWLDRAGGRIVGAGPQGAGRWIRGKTRLEISYGP